MVQGHTYVLDLNLNLSNNTETDLIYVTDLIFLSINSSIVSVFILLQKRCEMYLAKINPISFH